MASTAPGATLTSTTAPGKLFTSRSELAEHYKSDWHKYNLKRREAGLPLLSEPDFIARWEAALALRKEKESDRKHQGKGHLKAKDRSNGTDKDKGKEGNKGIGVTAPDQPTMDEADPMPSQSTHAELIATSQENPEIDPNQCLFDSHTSPSLEDNVKYMQQKFGFFLPDQEHISDLEGLLGYCHEKIKLGHYCLYCEKLFPTWQGCQKHMINKSHAKLRYEPGHWDEFDIFYDFSNENKIFVQRHKNKDSSIGESGIALDNGDADYASDEEDWEDISESGSDINVDSVFDDYQKEIAGFGLDVTPLGELVFPDGRVVGHRALRKYYRQRVRAPNSSNPAILAAQQSSGDRLFDGRLVNIGTANSKPPSSQKGIGRGILVRSGDTGNFTALSLYRLRAVMRKQRKDDDKGRRAKHRSSLNINRMDKKANRIMNGVSVAHAKR